MQKFAILAAALLLSTPVVAQGITGTRTWREVREAARAYPYRPQGGIPNGYYGYHSQESPYTWREVRDGARPAFMPKCDAYGCKQ